MTTKRPAVRKWTAAPPSLVTAFSTALEALPRATVRKMFGYPAAFVNGNMFAGLFKTSAILRLSPQDRTDCLGIEGAKPFDPMPGRIMKEYVVIPKSILDSPEALARWLSKAFSFAEGLVPKTTGKGKTGKE